MRSLRLLSACRLLTRSQDSKSPIPSAAEQKKGEQGIRELFKEEYKSKDPEAKRGLALKLMGQAADAKNDLATRYVCLRDAKDFAAEAADLTTAYAAIDKLSELFEVKGAELKSEALTTAKKSARSPAAAERLAYVVLEGVFQAMDRNAYDEAAKQLKDLDPLLKGAQVPALTQKVGDVQRELPERKKEFEEAAKAEVSLAANAEDPEANLKLGKYLCFVKGDWERGASLLRKGSDEKLRKLAEHEMLSGKDPDARYAQGEAWFAAGDKLKVKKDKDRYLARAVYWFEQALADAGGITKGKIQKRLNELASIPRGGGSAPPVNLLSFADPAKDRAIDWKWDGGALVSPPGNFQFYTFPYHPPEEYDVSLLVTGSGALGDLALMFPLQERNLAINLGGPAITKLRLVAGAVESKEHKFIVDSLKSGKPCAMSLLVRRTKVQLVFDNKIVLDWAVDMALANPKNYETGQTDIKAFTIFTMSSYTLHRLTITPISGVGKKLR